MNDYLKEHDLNAPPVGFPVNQPFDPRAMHYFGFLANGQEIRNMSAVRILASWQYANQPTTFSPPTFPSVDIVLDPGETVRYDELHDRAHVIVWIDPSAGIPTGPANVRIRAWAKI
jgi:hypothetical protein